MSDIDRAAGNVLRAKFAARLFDGAKYRDPSLIGQFVHNVKHRQLARSAAHEGSVLLKNAAPPLPPVPSNCRSVLGYWVGVRACSSLQYSEPRPAWFYPKILVLTHLFLLIIKPLILVVQSLPEILQHPARRGV